MFRRYSSVKARVLANQILINLDAVDAEIKLSRARSNLADAESNLTALDATESKDQEALQLDQEALNILQQKLTRIQNLRQRNLSSEQDLDTARQAVVTQKLQINRRELALSTVDSKRTQLKTAIQRFEAEVRAATRDFNSTAVRHQQTAKLLK